MTTTLFSFTIASEMVSEGGTQGHKIAWGTASASCSPKISLVILRGEHHGSKRASQRLLSASMRASAMLAICTAPVYLNRLLAASCIISMGTAPSKCSHDKNLARSGGVSFPSMGRLISAASQLLTCHPDLIWSSEFGYNTTQPQRHSKGHNEWLEEHHRCSVILTRGDDYNQAALRFTIADSNQVKPECKLHDACCAQWVGDASEDSMVQQSGLDKVHNALLTSKSPFSIDLGIKM